MKTTNLTYRLLTALIGLSLLLGQSVFAQQSTSTDSGDKTTYPPGTAWVLSGPLGLHEESSVDTVLYNYQRQFVAALTSDAWASTGQFTGPGINMIYFDRPAERDFFFNDAISDWLPSFEKQKFYNMYVPFTQLSYGWGFGTENRTDHLKAIFAGNVNRKIGIGAWIDYPYTKGSYAAQATKGLGYGFSGYYAGDRYEMQAFFNHTNHLNKENGGITDDLYITDPAELQGGVNTIEPKSIPVNLNAAHNRLVGSHFYMSHAYNVGFWRDLTMPEDTVERKEYVPVTRFVYAFDWKKDHRLFLNTNASEGREFWQDTYFNSGGTRQNDNYWRIGNTLGIEMVEGFQKWAKFGLSAYVEYAVDKFRYDVDGMDAIMAGTASTADLTPLPDGWENSLSALDQHLWVGGRLQKTQGSILRYSADAKFGIAGHVAGEIDLAGNIETNFRLGRDTVSLSAEGAFSNLEPNGFYEDYVGNHFVWHHDFDKIQKYRVGGSLFIPWTNTSLSVNFENIGNYIYLDPSGLPRQHSGQIQVFAAQLDQKLKFGIWNWDNTLTYQTTSDKSILPLPALSVYSNMYLYFHAFRALTVQVGLDVNWYSRYQGLAYQPATMSFHTQGADPVNVGNFIFSDVYLTCKLYKVRFFLMCSHLNQGWFSKGYFSLPHYPVDPRQFRLGLSIDFAN